MAAAIPYVIMAAGAIYSAQQQRRQQEYSAAIDEANAKLARDQTAVAEEQLRRRNTQQMGYIRASAIDTGFDPGTGSLLNLQTKSAAEMELDVLTARYRGELEAIGLQTDAGVKRNNARTATRQGYVNAASYLASGYSDYSRQTRIDGMRNG